jgi:hypothetical protein
MNRRYPVHLTTMQEDFKAIGLIPEDSLTEDYDEMTEGDDPRHPRDIPSPDPSTLAGNDDSEGSINAKARHKYARQPRPRIAPSDKNDHDDPMDAGGKMKSKGGYNKKPNYREGVDGNPRHEYPDGYKTLRKRLVDKSKGAHYDGGEDPDVAQGLSPTNSIGGMRKESAYVSRASALIGELDALVSGSQVNEDFDNLGRGFSLLGENAALLAERLVDISDDYDVEDVYAAMESLYDSACEAFDIVEMKVTGEKERKAAIANGANVKEEGFEDEASVEDIKDAFRLMTLDLMDAVESYDSAIAEMCKDDEDEGKGKRRGRDDDDDDDDEKNESVSDRLSALRAARGHNGPLGR